MSATEPVGVQRDDRVRLLSPLPLNRPPLKKLSTGTMQRRARYASRNEGRSRDRPALGVDRLATAGWIVAPMRDQPRAGADRATPRRSCGCDVARRRVPPRRIVVHAAIAQVHPVDDVPKRPAALDHSILRFSVRRTFSPRQITMSPAQ
jgi:hypothetical protein